jgi:heme iron utilization protein
VPHERHADPLQQMNANHGDGLLLAARAFAGHPDATAARAERVDQSGIDVRLETPSGPTDARVEFTEPIPDDDYPGGVRVAFVRLVRRARTAAINDIGGDAGPS